MSMSKIDEEKMMLREHYRRMRQKMTAPYKRSLDLDITSRLLCSDEYMRCKYLLAYAAMPTEIETRWLIEAALLNGKQVYLPRCEGEGIMNFYPITSLRDLTVGSYNIPEPKATVALREDCHNEALCVVPALSFDPSGNRLGSGKGFYDRFLRNFGGESVGVCYGSFVKWSLPVSEYDVPVDMLVTDSYLRKTAD